MKTSFSIKARSGLFLKEFQNTTICPPDSIYFMGICGTAMASLAVHLKNQGFHVFGSDKDIYPPMSDVLRKSGISVSEYKTDNLNPSIRLVVVGNVISRNHTELSKVHKLGIPCLSLPEFLNQTFLKQSKNLVVAGTHGKSTSTGLMAHVGEVSGKNPNFFLGAVPEDFPLSFRSTDSPWFVIEGDEYDSSFFVKKPKFFYYKPFSVLLTGIEFDHGDIYKNMDEIVNVFCEFIKKIPPSGYLVACTQNQRLKEVVKHSRASVVTYGIKEGDYRLQNRYVQDERQIFDIVYEKEKHLCSIPFFGEHNALNALGVFALSHKIGWPVKKILFALKTFKGIRKRLEFIGFLKGAEIYEDFAHHPTAVSATLSALREKGGRKRLIALFEPRSFTSRLNIFQKDYIKSFIKADIILISEPCDTSKIPADKRFSSEKLVKNLQKQGKKAVCYKNFEEMEKDFISWLNIGDRAVFMSSGSFGGLLSKIRS